MVERVKKERKPGGDYFPAPKASELIRSGCTLLDCILGGGQGAWMLGRMCNIVGDKSVGKTLLAIESAANFHIQYPKGDIDYRESEQAFDVPYAQVVGLPAKHVNFGPQGKDTRWDTVEDIFEDLYKVLERIKKKNQPGAYIIDSLDALTTRAIRKRSVDKGDFGEKAKVISNLFSDLVRDFGDARLLLMIVSQIRDNIGATFGRKWRRAGGKAMDFYASGVVYLSHRERIVEEKGKVKRAVGIRVKALCEKNKVALPYRTCEFDLRFGFGVDDLSSCLDWLDEVKYITKVPDWTEKDLWHAASAIQSEDPADWKDYRAAHAVVRPFVLSKWTEVEDRFRPRMRKYEE